MKRAVVILGGGVGGLVAAHELSKDLNIEVHVYERHSSPGGHSRSVGEDVKDYSEYCWHVFGNGYIHLLPILKEIPYGSGTVADRLVGMSQFLYGRYPVDESPGVMYDERGDCFLTGQSLFGFLRGVWRTGGVITFWDVVLLFRAFVVALIGCVERLNLYGNVPWPMYMNRLSPEAKKWIVDSPSIYLGMRSDNLSTQLMLSLFRGRKNFRDQGYPRDFYSFDGPVHKLWFEPWVEYLRSRGVKFYFNEIVKSVDMGPEHQIQSVFLESGKVVSGDVFVNALGIEQWAKILPNSDTHTAQFRQLAEFGRQIQCHVLYRLHSKLKLQGPCIIVLPDTEWCIMVRVEGSVWRKEWELPDSKDLLCAGVGIWHRPGINNKTAEECTREEIAEEVWRQIQKNDGLMEYLILSNGESLSTLSETPEWDIWKSYVYIEGGIDTYEPKFSNSVGTLERRPEVKDAVCGNLYHATAYAKTEINVFCMESAAEAGVKVAKHITSSDPPPSRLKEDGIWVKVCNWLRGLDAKYLMPEGYPLPTELINVPRSNKL